jgi:hypothetical protein
MRTWIRSWLILPVRECMHDIQALHRECLLALAMGLHVRLGAKSLVKLLGADMARLVMLFYFGLTPEKFDQQNGADGEYAVARKAAESV